MTAQTAHVDPYKTQNPQTVHVDMRQRTATLTFQWMLEKSLSHPIHPSGNALEFLIGGEAGFDRIAQDINAAQDSIDIICWGFDPGMALQREDPNTAKPMPAYPWAHGEPYGELLKRKAQAGVKVRLLVWYDKVGSIKQQSLPGYVDTDNSNTNVLKLNSPLANGHRDRTWTETHRPHNQRHRSHVYPPHEQRLDYCTKWWRQATCGQIPNLEVRCRNGVSDSVKRSLAEERLRPTTEASTHGGVIHEKGLLEDYATHHQKPVLIDYAYNNGAKAVGYVMGLNSVTDYWDSAEHLFDDPRRETDHLGASDGVAQGAVKRGRPISRKPFSDYACRLEGPALAEVHRNFATAWNRAELLPQLLGPQGTKSQATRSAELDPKLVPSALAKRDLGLPMRVQVLRTQPEESYTDAEQRWAFDKSIKHAYFQATSFARNYLYVENQYFYYEEWVQHLTANRKAFNRWVQAAGAKSQDVRLLHLFVVIPEPEDPGMIPRTYDTLKSLGQAQAMKGQDERYAEQDEVLKEQQKWDARYAALPASQRRVAEGYGGTGMAYAEHILGPRPTGETPDVLNAHAKQIEAPMADKDGVLYVKDAFSKDKTLSLGLKVLAVKMVSQNPGGNTIPERYRDIYVHSKLMMIDDCYATLGSANMNQRSMAADSEINVATDHIPTVRDLRQRVWGMQTGKDSRGIAMDGSVKAIKDAFDYWKSLAENNKLAVDYPKKSRPFTGHIVQLEDKRKSDHRYG